METVWDLVRDQAERTPDEPAAVGVQVHSYRDVTQRAEALAALIRRTVEPGALLALETSSPVSGAIALLAGAQAGCAILPMNLESPPAHRELILDDARPAAVIRALQEAVFTVDRLDMEPAADTAGRDLHDVAYILYTSGSTGRPKE